MGRKLPKAYLKGNRLTFEVYHHHIISQRAILSPQCAIFVESFAMSDSGEEGEDFSDSGSEYQVEEDEIGSDIESEASSSGSVSNEDDFDDETDAEMFKSKDGKIWSRTPILIDRGRNRNENIITMRPGTHFFIYFIFQCYSVKYFHI